MDARPYRRVGTLNDQQLSLWNGVVQREAVKTAPGVSGVSANRQGRTQAAPNAAYGEAGDGKGKGADIRAN